MKTKDVSTETPKTSCKEPQNVPTMMFSNRKPIRISAVENESSYCCSVLKHHFHSVMSSKIPTYFCVSMYVLICLLGNVVTGIIWYHQLIGDHQQQENVSLSNETILRFVWNETTKIDESNGFEVFDEEGEEILDILDFLANKSTDNYQVNSY